mgnify:CR=1 FL=1
MVDIQVRNLTKFFVIGENLLDGLTFDTKMWSTDWAALKVPPVKFRNGIWGVSQGHPALRVQRWWCAAAGRCT